MATWSILVPQKAIARAKGRLELPEEQRRSLAIAMLRDTVAAAQASAWVTRVFVIWDDPADATVLTGVESLPAPGLGLNESLEYAVQEARRRDPGAGVAVLPSDLPALDPGELALCLTRAARRCRAHLADASGRGTTLLTATGDFPLLPAYGADSAWIHAASGSARLSGEGVDTVRADVDDLGSLATALALGCGHYTLSCCASLGLALEIAR